ncbi:hypothetical protein N0V88_003917 [Collariella sp. IMI 366227]|nr:hypothetical protein N0V88_003917 [Collariella sp. IMI 366227]
MTDSSHFLVCNACGTQHPTTNRTTLTTCFICDDPRQYTPPEGQSFTTLANLREAGDHHNEFHPFPGGDTPFTSIVTSPRFAIGERAILIRTPEGERATVEKIKGMGGIKAMVISHPHFYSTHLEWAERFECKVYLAAEDKKWLARRDEDKQVFLDEIEMKIEVDGKDTGGNPRQRPKGVNSFSFLWSIPNMIPLSAGEILRMWNILKNYDFTGVHGLFLGWDIEDKNVKARVLESMQIQVRAMGYSEHSLLKEAR